MALFRRERSPDEEQENNFTNRTANLCNQVVKRDPLGVIYNEGQWRLHKVTPMQKLRYQPVKLKYYASKVKQALISVVQVPSAKYNVVFEELPHLKYSERDASAVMITVKTQPENAKEPKVTYTAILLSWGVSLNLDKTTHLPYMLERGDAKVSTAVQTTLRTVFDCTIWQCHFTQYHLLQFGFSFVDCDSSSKNSDPFILIYKTPQADKDKLKFSFHMGDIQMIWNGVQDENKTQTEQVKTAYQLIQNHIFDAVMLDIIVCDLCEIKTPKAEVKTNGIVRMKTPEMVNCVFTLLNKMIAEQEKDYVEEKMIED